MSQDFRLGFEIKMDRAFNLRPSQIEYWTQQDKFSKIEPQSPFHYHGDLLTGASLVLLNPFLKTPLLKGTVPFQLCQKLWSQLDPHHQVFESCQERVQSLRKSFPSSGQIPTQPVEKFEKNLQKVLENAQKPWGINLNEFQDFVDSIFHLESELKAPLLYNWKVRFSDSTVQSLHVLYSFLFHLRSLVAFDYNLQIKDPSYEALKLDSISDYIPRPDYVAQDAILFWKFKSQTKPFEKDSKMWNLLIRPTLQSFQNHSHNAFYLVEHLPESFVQKLPPSEMPETLHLVQMDWLLGTEAGLLYRIREELYGLLGGYEKLFWVEELNANFRTSNLTIHTQISQRDLEKLVA